MGRFTEKNIWRPTFHMSKLGMNKLEISRHNLGRVFNSRSGWIQDTNKYILLWSKSDQLKVENLAQNKSRFFHQTGLDYCFLRQDPYLLMAKLADYL